MQHKKSTSQKKIEGTFRPDRDIENPVNFNTLTVLPKKDQGSEFANGYYEKIGKLLISNRLLTGADLPALERAAGWFHVYAESRKMIMDGKFIQVAPSGYSNISAHLTAYEKSHRYLSEFENSFGLNPLSRQKIGMPAQEEMDELEKLLNS